MNISDHDLEFLLNMNPGSNMRFVAVGEIAQMYDIKSSQLEAELDKYEPVVWWCRKCDASFEDENDKIDHEVDEQYFCINCDMVVGHQG